MRKKEKAIINPEDFRARRQSRRMSRIPLYEVIDRSPDPVKKMQTYEWFLEPQFYLVTCLYMAARLFINLSQTYITFYVQYALQLSPDMLAIIPMVMFISGFAISIVLGYIGEKVGYRVSFLISCFIGIGKFIVDFPSIMYTLLGLLQTILRLNLQNCKSL